MRFEHELDPEELTELFDSLDSGLDRRPLPAVLDTACVRTGLHFQLRNGSPPASVTTARDGEVRVFMEYDTLAETGRKLPKFARDLGVTVAELRRILNEEWLPYIQVVKLPPSLRQLDPRALSVRDSDADGYPAAALAALLSSCILLMHNHNDFAALGVDSSSQGVDAVMAVIAINIGEMRVHAVLVVPALPVRLAAAGVKWASERIGLAAWVILLNASRRPRVDDLRAYLRGNDALFAQVRRGGFELGQHYQLPDVG
ncbi:MAG: hypothetical protein ACRDPO_05020 [Streptosporangiaceae bacterium]